MLLDTNPSSPLFKCMLLTTLARCVWRDDFDTIQNICSRSDLAAQLFDLSNQTIQLCDPADFASQVDAAKTAQLAISSEDISRLPKCKQKSRANFLAKLTKLWIPTNKAIFLDGVLTNNGIVSGKIGQLHALAVYWGPTFAPKHIDIPKTQQFLDQYATPYVFSEVPVIGIPHYLEYF